MIQQKYNYVYKITNLKPTDKRKFYIGVRSSKVNPNKDNYWSSSKIIKKMFKENPNNFKKDILFIFDTRKKAIDKEIKCGHNQNKRKSSYKDFSRVESAQEPATKRTGNEGSQ